MTVPKFKKGDPVVITRPVLGLPGEVVPTRGTVMEVWPPARDTNPVVYTLDTGGPTTSNYNESDLEPVGKVNPHAALIKRAQRALCLDLQEANEVVRPIIEELIKALGGDPYPNTPKGRKT